MGLTEPSNHVAELMALNWSREDAEEIVLLSMRFRMCANASNKWLAEYAIDAAKRRPVRHGRDRLMVFLRCQAERMGDR